MAQHIEDYALIGDCESAALVGRDGFWYIQGRSDDTLKVKGDEALTG